jgi:hypothetical protein
MRTSDSIEQIFRRVKELFHEISRLCEEVNQTSDDYSDRIENPVSLREGQPEQHCTIGSGRVCMSVSWVQPFNNSLDSAFLGVREFNENTITPAGRIRLDRPEVIREKGYDPELSRAWETGRAPQDGEKDFISSKELANQFVIQFLDLMNRDAAGEITRTNRR